MSDRNKFKDRLDREVRQGRITNRERKQALKGFDRRQGDDRDSTGDAIEGIIGFVWEALGLGRED